MGFQVLGPLRVTADGQELPLGGRQQRLVLALLVSARGRTVSTDALIEGVWGDEPPPTARKALQGYVHHLRTAIGESLATENNGYSLDTGGEVDAAGFVRLHEEGAGLVDSDPERAAHLLRAALRLWNGSAYADLSDELALLPEVARLENLRLAAVGDRVDADLALGRHEALIGELEALTLEYPFQERFRAQRMTVLYRAGRQTEALRSFERFRRFLADESGLEPSAELTTLEQRILAQDADLKAAPHGAQSSDPAVIRGYELREMVGSDDVSRTYRAYQRSVGRQVAVRVIGARVADDPTFISNFLGDSQRIASIDHPHIAYIFDAWREPGRAFQVTRWLGGGTLDEHSAAGTTAGLAILDRVGDALAHVHRQGAAHGSIDGSHVVFDDGGHPYLFGFDVGVQLDDDAPAKDRTDLAVLAHRVLAGRPPTRRDGRFEPDVDDPSLAPVFELAFSDDGYGRVEDFLRALRQAIGTDVVASTPDAPPRSDVRNPYKGLKAFQENDAADFFGRDGVVDRLVDTMQRQHLVAVVGPSGSGKSSAVKAGLLPRLRSQRELVLVAEMYPGAFPFEELEGALLRVGVDRRPLMDDLVSDERGLLRVLKRILPSDDADLVLVIDQFEELFSTVDDEATRELFMNSLVAAVSEPRSRLRVVLTLRADFFDRPLEHARFGELVEAGLVPVSVPGDDDLAQAIVLPARREGVEFEDGLVPQIVADVAGQAGGLPLLQYALTELFEARDSDRLTLAAYQRSGGVHGALGRRAEEIHSGLGPAEQSAVREAFLRMVTVDENADDLRRRVRRSDLVGVGDRRHLDDALQAFASARLVTFDRDPVTRGPTVEVAHEALLREWPQLREWIEAQRDDLVIRRRLDAALDEWEQSGEDDGYLPTGSRLAQFEEWSAETELALSGPERAFLQAGVERETAGKERAARRRRGVMAGFAVVTVVAVVLALLAVRSAQTASDNATRADAETLAAAAVGQLDADRERAALLALQSLELAETPNGLVALHQALHGDLTVWRRPGQNNPAFVLHPDGRHVATMSATGQVEYWDVEGDSSEPLWTAQISDGNPVFGQRPWLDEDTNTVTFAISDFGDPAAGFTNSVIGEHRGLYTLDLADGELVEVVSLEGCVDGPFFQPLGLERDEAPAIAAFRHEVSATDPSICEPVGPPEFVVRRDATSQGWLALDLPVDALASSEFHDLSTDGDLFTVAGQNGAWVLDTGTGQVVETHDASRATLSRNSQRILLSRGWADGSPRVDLVDRGSGDIELTIPGRFHWMRFTPDQRLLVGLDGSDGSISVFDAGSGAFISELNGSESPADAFRFGGASDRVIVLLRSGELRMVELGPGSGEVRPPVRRVVESEAPPDWGTVEVGGGLVFSASLPDLTYMVQDETGNLVRSASALRGFMSPDGSMILEMPIVEPDVRSPSGSEAILVGRPRLVEAKSGALISELPSTCTFYDGAMIEPGPDCEDGRVPVILTDAKFSERHDVLAIESVSGRPAVLDLSTNEMIFDRDVVGKVGWDLQPIALSPDGALVAFEVPGATAGQLGFGFEVVDVRSGEIVGSGATCDVSKAMFDADGTKLYLADLCSNVVVLETGTWSEVARFGRGRDDAIADLDVSGGFLATGGTDGFVRVWDIDDGVVVLDVQLSTIPNNVEFLDESHILVATTEGEALVFTLDTNELQTIALDRLSRGLTDEECDIYDINPCPDLDEMRS